MSDTAEPTLADLLDALIDRASDVRTENSELAPLTTEIIRRFDQCADSVTPDVAQRFSDTFNFFSRGSAEWNADDVIEFMAVLENAGMRLVSTR